MSSYHMQRVTAQVPNSHREFIQEFSKESQISMSRLIAFMIDNEMSKPKEEQFKFDITLPDLSEYQNFAFSEYSTQILDFMKTIRTGLAIDILVLLRFQIGIPDKINILAGFAELLEQDMIEGFVPKPKRNAPPYPEGYLWYRVKDQKSVRKIDKEARDFQKFIALHEKYKDVKTVNASEALAYAQYVKLKPKYEKKL